MIGSAFGLLALVLVAGQPAAKPAEASFDDIVAGLQETEASIRNLEVTTDYVKLQKFMLEVDKPVRMQLSSRTVVHRDGRAFCDCIGEQINMGPKPTDFRIYRGRWQRAFDGKVARSMTGDAAGVFHFGRIDRHMTWHGINPLEFTTHYFGKPVSEILDSRGGAVTGKATWEGRPVVVVETVPRGKNDKRRYRFWIDPQRKTVVRRAIAIQFAPGQKWQEYTRIESSAYKEVAPGIWLPMRAKYESLHVTKEMKPEELSWSYEGRNRDWKVNQQLLDETFELSFPDNVIVTNALGSNPPEKKK